MYAIKKNLAHTQEVSHILLDLANLVRGKIPDIFWRLGTEAEITESDLGIQDWFNERGFRVLGISWWLRPSFVCGGGKISRDIVKISECVRGHVCYNTMTALES